MRTESPCWLLALVLASQLSASPALPAQAWPVTRQWNRAEEVRYSEWVGRIGRKSWKSANQMLHDRGANSLFDQADDAITFRADCGDLPDQSVTRIAFGEKLNWRSASHFGGFLAYRPIRVDAGKVVYEENQEKLPGYSLEQHSTGSNYHRQVKLRLATEKLDPVRDLENYIRNDTYPHDIDTMTEKIAPEKTKPRWRLFHRLRKRD